MSKPPTTRRDPDDDGDLNHETPTPKRQRHPMDQIDLVMRRAGHGIKRGEGIAFLLRSVAAQHGIGADAFNVEIDDDAEAELNSRG